jgi:hypothetical protein
MRSLRSRFETACRVLVFALLGWLLGTTLFPTTARRVERASDTDVATRLVDWTRAPASVALHGDFKATPARWVVDWLAALRRSTHAVTWSGTPFPLAVVAEPLVDPHGGTRIDVAAPAGARIAIRDDASLIDTLRIANLGGSLTTPIVVGNVVANAGGEQVTIRAPDSVRVRSIVVTGSAGWEGKFIVAALEERGWPVIARFSVAPSVDVSQGAPLVLDTSRVAAVIAVDSVISVPGSIEQYVRSGGGLVLVGPASRARGVSAIAPGSIGVRFRPATLPKDTLTLGSTGFYPVAVLRDDAVTLERRAGGVTVAARRVGAGRVIQTGYDDSWRWRMAGASGSENAHRGWWSRLVSSVAYASAVPAAEAGGFAAPVADLVERLGLPRPVSTDIATRAPVDRRVLLAIIMILLLTEWASRRLRGLR